MRECVNSERDVLLFLEAVEGKKRWPISEDSIKYTIHVTMRRTYDKTITISGSPLLPTGSYVRRLMPGCTTRGSCGMLGKYALNTPEVKLELARMISAFPNAIQCECWFG